MYFVFVLKYFRVCLSDFFSCGLSRSVDTDPVLNGISWNSKMANGGAMETDLIKVMSYRSGKIVLAGLWGNVLYYSKMNRRGFPRLCIYFCFLLFSGRGAAFSFIFLCILWFSFPMFIFSFSFACDLPPFFFLVLSLCHAFLCVFSSFLSFHCLSPFFLLTDFSLSVVILSGALMGKGNYLT